MEDPQNFNEDERMEERQQFFVEFLVKLYLYIYKYLLNAENNHYRIYYI